MPEEAQASCLQLVKLIGQRGDIVDCLEFAQSPDAILYPLSRSIVEQRLDNNDKQQILHQCDVSKISCFKFCHQKLAVGEESSQGSYAKVLVLDKGSESTPTEAPFEYCMHLSTVKSIGISQNGRFVASLGGEDDGK